MPQENTNSVTQNNDVVKTTLSSETSNHKRPFFSTRQGVAIVLALAVLAGVLGGAYLYSQRNKDDNTANPASNTNNNSANTNPASLNGEYKDESWDLQMKLGDVWNIEKVNSELTGALQPLSNVERVEATKNTRKLYIFKWDQTTDEKLKAVIDSATKPEYYETYRAIKADGVNAYRDELWSHTGGNDPLTVNHGLTYYANEFGAKNASSPKSLQIGNNKYIVLFAINIQENGINRANLSSVSEKYNSEFAEIDAIVSSIKSVSGVAATPSVTPVTNTPVVTETRVNGGIYTIKTTETSMNTKWEIIANGQTLQTFSNDLSACTDLTFSPALSADGKSVYFVDQRDPSKVKRYDASMAVTTAYTLPSKYKVISGLGIHQGSIAISAFSDVPKLTTGSSNQGTVENMIIVDGKEVTKGDFVSVRALNDKYIVTENYLRCAAVGGGAATITVHNRANGSVAKSFPGSRVVSVPVNSNAINILTDIKDISNTPPSSKILDLSDLSLK
jgi:hypothetical protein